MNTIRLTIAIIILAGVASARTDYQLIDTTDFANRAAAYEGQLVVVSGRVCAVNANGRGLQLFDSDSKALIDVSLTRLQRNLRRAVMFSPVQRVSVYGRAQVRNGKLVIDADKVIAQTVEGNETSSNGR